MRSSGVLKRLLLGRFLSTLADQFLLFAVPLIVFKTTGSVAMTGLAFAIEWLPRVVSLPLAGVLSDKLGSKRVFLTADAVRAAVCLLTFGLLLALPGERVFLLLALMSACVAFFYAQGFIALEAALPRILSVQELPKAQAICQGIEQVSGIGGPLLASLIGAFVTPESLILCAALMFAVSFVANAGLPEDASEMKCGVEVGSRSLQLVADLKTALGHVRRLPGLLVLVLYTINVNFMYGLIRALAAPLVAGTFGMPDQYYGMLNSISAVATLLVLFAVPWLNRRMGLAMIGLTSFSALVLSSFGAGVARGFWGFSVAFALLHAGDALFNVYIRTERAKVIPREDMGKTIGFIVCLNQLSIPLSGLLVSHFSETMGPRNLILATTLFCLVGALALWLGTVGRSFVRRARVQSPA